MSAFDDRGKIFTHVINKEPVDAVIQTTTHRIYGKIHIRTDQRISDELNASDHFLSVTEAKVIRTDGTTEFVSSFVAISIAQIVWVLPATHLSEESNP